jgi:hypothetical protein
MNIASIYPSPRGQEPTEWCCVPLLKSAAPFYHLHTNPVCNPQVQHLVIEHFLRSPYQALVCRPLQGICLLLLAEKKMYIA